MAPDDFSERESPLSGRVAIVTGVGECDATER